MTLDVCDVGFVTQHGCKGFVSCDGMNVAVLIVCFAIANGNSCSAVRMNCEKFGIIDAVHC